MWFQKKQSFWAISINFGEQSIFCRIIVAPTEYDDIKLQQFTYRSWGLKVPPPLKKGGGGSTFEHSSKVVRKPSKNQRKNMLIPHRIWSKIIHNTKKKKDKKTRVTSLRLGTFQNPQLKPVSVWYKKKAVSMHQKVLLQTLCGISIFFRWFLLGFLTTFELCSKVDPPFF